VNVTYRTVSDWGAGFTGEITVINNTSQTLSNWALECDFAPRLTNVWSAVLNSHTGTHYIFKNESYNGALAPGAKATFGFQGDPGNPPLPTNAKVNGVSVTVTKP
jgi:cellulase/cellobiase CelA1